MAKQNEDGSYSLDLRDPDNDYLKIEHRDRGVFINGKNTDGIKNFKLDLGGNDGFVRVSFDAVVPIVNVLVDFSAFIKQSS